MLSHSHRLLVLLFWACMDSSSWSYDAGLAHCLVFSHICLLFSLIALSSWDREWECGLMDSLFQVDGLPKCAMGLLFCCLPFLVFVSLRDTETSCSHSPHSAFLTSAIKDGYGSLAVLAFPSRWLRLWDIFPSGPSQALSVTLVLLWIGKKTTR